MKQICFFAAVMGLSLSATGVMAESWTLNGEMSNVAFGSIKNEYVGEVHRFGAVSGGVDTNGLVALKLDLGSIQTGIDIRDERMIEHVFENAPDATIAATIDMTVLEGLDIGEWMETTTTGTLSLLGNDVDLDASFFVIRLGEDQVMVTTDGMIMLATDEAGFDPGIDVLQELAGLDSITRVSPVTLRLVFDKDS